MIGRRSSGKKERVCLEGEGGGGSRGSWLIGTLYFLSLRGGLIESGAIAVANCVMMCNAAWLRLTLKVATN